MTMISQITQTGRAYIFIIGISKRQQTIRVREVEEMIVHVGASILFKIIISRPTLNTKLIIPSTFIDPYILLHWGYGTLIRGGTLYTVYKKRGYSYYIMDFFPTGTHLDDTLMADSHELVQSTYFDCDDKFVIFVDYIMLNN